MSERVLASDPLSLLALVPELVGFEPRESLVLITFRAKATSGTFRVALPVAPPGERSPDRDALRLYASTLVGMACKIRAADGLLSVVYTDASCRADAPQRALVDELAAAASAAGFIVRDALYVAADGWGDYSSPPGPRTELDAASRLRRLDPDSTPVRRPPHEEAELPVVDESDRESTATAIAAMRDDPIPDPVWLAEYCAAWAIDEIGPSSSALVGAVLSQPWARDVMLFTWAWGSAVGRRAARFQERHSRGETLVDDRISVALAGMGSWGRPSVSGVRHAIEVLRHVVARLPSSERAPGLSALAWLSWALGGGSVAGEYVRQAREIDPDYGFADLVETMLDRGMMPDWAFDDESRDVVRSRRRDAFGRVRR